MAAIGMRCLIIANKTLPNRQLAEATRERYTRERCAFYVVVPLDPISHRLTWDEEESIDAARSRLDAFLGHLRERGMEADGEIGDADPVQALQDVTRRLAIDDIIVSTLPPGTSRWLRVDVPARLRRAAGVPVTVVTG
jgi:nucleotide-binding universal stress UspA family protein